MTQAMPLRPIDKPVPAGTSRPVQTAAPRSFKPQHQPASKAATAVEAPNLLQQQQRQKPQEMHSHIVSAHPDALRRRQAALKGCVQDFVTASSLYLPLLECSATVSWQLGGESLCDEREADISYALRCAGGQQLVCTLRSSPRPHGESGQPGLPCRRALGCTSASLATDYLSAQPYNSLFNSNARSSGV